MSNEGYITTDDGVRLFFRSIGNHSNHILIPNGFYFFDEFKRFTDHHTLIFYDVRNRGLSDSVNDPAKLSRGIEQDADDLDTVRRHFGIDQVDVIGHSYIGLMIALYAKRYGDHLKRLVQVGPSPPDSSKQYAADLTNNDGVIQEVFSKIAQIQKENPSSDPVEVCKRFWSVLRRIYVANPADASKINWGRCELSNERNFMKYWTEHIFPSIQRLHLTAEDFVHVPAPVLIIHGKKDRSAPYGGGCDWAKIFPNGRLFTLPDAVHAPWIEAPEIVFPAIADFLRGSWPSSAESISAS